MMVYEAGAELPVWAPLAVPLALRAGWQMVRTLGWWFLGWPLVGRLRRRRMSTADAEAVVFLAHGGDATIPRGQYQEAIAVLGETKAQLYDAVRARDAAEEEAADLRCQLINAQRGLPVQTLAQFTQYDADAHSRRYP